MISVPPPQFSQYYPLSMGLKAHIIDFEEGQISAFHSAMLSIKKISKAVKRSTTTVWRFLKRHNEGSIPRSPRNARKISENRTKRLIRKASNGDMSTRKLCTALILSFGTRRIQHILEGTPHLMYRKMQKAPYLTVHNKLKRLEWARRFISRGDHYWTNSIFRMKKINLDWADELSYCGHVIRREKRPFLLGKKERDLLCLGCALHSTVLVI